MLSGWSLGRGREERLWKRLALLEPGRHRDAMYGARLVVLGPCAAGEVPSHDRLEWEDLAAPHDAAAVLQRGSRRLRNHIGQVESDKVRRDVWQLLLDQADPVCGEQGKQTTFLRDAIRHRNIMGRDPISSYKEQLGCIEAIEVADFAGGEEGERGRDEGLCVHESG